MTIGTNHTAKGALLVTLNGKRTRLDRAVNDALTGCNGNSITIANEHGVSYDYYGHCYRYSARKSDASTKRDLANAVRSFADYH